MLAEIFMLRLEMQLRIAATNAVRTSSDTRFVPVTTARHLAQAGPIPCAADTPHGARLGKSAPARLGQRSH